MKRTLDLQKLYNEIGRSQVKFYVNRYRQYFKSISMDDKDIQQEIYLLIMQLNTNYPDADEETFRKIINNSIKYKLCNMVDSAITSSIKLTNKDIKKELDKLLEDGLITKDMVAIGDDFFNNSIKRGDIIKKYDIDRNEFRNILRQLRMHFATKNNFMRVTRLASTESGESAQESTIGVSSPVRMDDVMSVQPKCIDRIQVDDMLGIIKARLSEKHYNIFYAKVMENKTNEEIQKLYRVSRERVRQILEMVREIFSKKVLTKV